MQPGERTVLKTPEAMNANGVLNSGDTRAGEMRILETHGQNGKANAVNSSDTFVLQTSILKAEGKENSSKAKTRNLSGFSASRPEKLTYYQNNQTELPGFVAGIEGSKRTRSFFLLAFTSAIPGLINCSREPLSQGRVWKVYLSQGH